MLEVVLVMFKQNDITVKGSLRGLYYILQDLLKYLCETN